MKLSELKKILETVPAVRFQLPDKTFVPDHFHVTEVGNVTKHFIDCGGVVRKENKINFQLWEAGDFDHRLAPKKLLDIINLSEKVIGILDNEIEVEYQMATIGKYNLEFDGNCFQLTQTQTNCLAPDKCGVPESKQKLKLSDLSKPTNACCDPKTGCC